MPSTVVASAQYDPSTLKLTVVFVSGTVYQYMGVPQEVYAAMKTSGSKGKFLNEEIKGYYDFEKLE